MPVHYTAHSKYALFTTLLTKAGAWGRPRGDQGRPAGVHGRQAGDQERLRGCQGL